VGTQWVYRGTTRGDYHDAKVVRRVQTTMRVMSRANVGRYEVAVIDGEPSTVGCDKVPEPRHIFTVIVRDGARYYELATSSPSPLDDELATEAKVAKAVEDAAIFLEVPLRGRATIGCEESEHPPMCCWTVASQPPREIAGKVRQPYRLVYRSNPTLETVEMAEGVGITRWQSVHHGSPCEIDLRLVSFRR
jgi:hypothetical protein